MTPQSPGQVESPAKNARSTEPERAATPSLRLPWWKKLCFGLLTTAALLIALESCLALLGVRPLLARRDPFVGFSAAVPHFQERGELGHAPRMRTAYNKLGYLNDQSFAVKKSPSTFRVFCLGGSTTFGRPYEDATSFVGWLRTLLEVTAPEQDWEVVNAGGVSYASYRVAAVMEELAAYEPDLFIIYAGHNEFLEARTYPQLRGSSRSRQWLTLAATRLRTASVIDRLLHVTRAPADVFELPDEVDTILDHTMGPTSYERDDAWRREIVAHFQWSLARMVDLAAAAGAEVVFVRPACNLKDCSPFKSEPKHGLSHARRQAWQLAFDDGQRWQLEGRHSEAVEAFAKATAIDDRQAELHYRMGRSLFALGRFAAAEVALRRAVDEDVCPLRMTSDLDGALNRLVARSGVPLVDMQEILQDHCRSKFGHAVLGSEYFLDHVHPTISAHGLLATALAERLRQEGVLPTGVAWSDSDLAAIQHRVHSSIDARARARAEGNLARVLFWSGKVEEAGPLALKCHEYEEDSRILLIAGGYLHQQGDTARALEFLHRAQRMNPADARIDEMLEFFQSERPARDT